MILQGEHNMECLNCQGHLKQGTAPFHIDRHGYHLTFEQVAALICEQCGEVYFGEQETQTIQTALQQLDEQTRRLKIAA
jgi:YgiT-type zinc finger domain-containing protein